jgi:hypothetical protein
MDRTCGMIDWDKICKQSMTLEVEVEVVHASYNETGRECVRGMHGGRNDRMKCSLQTRRLVAYCPSEIRVFG